MRISTRAQYGMRLMYVLGLHYGQGPVFLKDIARSEEISEKYLSQIIIPLRVAGFVLSHRGAHGGYELAKPPKDVTMKDIVGILEGNFNLVESAQNQAHGAHMSLRVTQHLWGMLGGKIADTLEEVSLHDLLQKSKELDVKCINYTI
ncbi:MAG: Rrf2 family transcriptional regulator [Candidatus Ancaeobacter aquaticus]|nr:Rrf2 family transcriptional regulator [Candidatus Ancaeobacter aquaticus]